MILEVLANSVPCHISRMSVDAASLGCLRKLAI
jgi:hypothetical protein